VDVLQQDLSCRIRLIQSLPALALLKQLLRIRRFDELGFKPAFGLSVVASPAILVGTVRTAFLAAFAIAVLHLAHAFERVFFHCFFFFSVPRGRALCWFAFFFGCHNVLYKTPKNLPQERAWERK
jgi:hypothetical protein